MKKVLCVVLLAMAMGAAGCGGVSDSQKQDAGNVAGGLSGSMGNQNGGNLQESSGSDLGEMSSTIHGLYWWAHFAAEAKAQEAQKLALSNGDASNFTLTTCPASSTAVTKAGTGASCTGSCNSALTVITQSCTIPDGKQETCGGTTYTFTSASASVTVDLTNLNINTSANPPSISGSVSVSMNFQANITGGKLDGKTLACNFATTVTPGTGGAASAPSINCGNFSCKWDNKDISCSDLQAKMGSGSCTKAN